MIVEVAEQTHRRDYLESSVVVEVVHSIFDDYSCAQWLRMSRGRKGAILVAYKGLKLRFANLKDFLATGCDIILQTMLHDFLTIAGTDLFTDMHFLSINVHHKKERMSIMHSYFTDELFQEYVVDNDRWGKDKQSKRIASNFRRQVIFASRIVVY